MGQISLQAPVVGEDFSLSAPKVDGNFTTIQTVINGNMDATNVSASLAQAATVNQSGQTVKGSSIIATSESRTNVAYGTLATPDQVTGITLASNGLIAVWYQATWANSLTGAGIGLGRAAIFLGSNQFTIAQDGVATPQTEAARGPGSTTNTAPLTSFACGLIGGYDNTASYGGDVTTGQGVGVLSSSGGGQIIDIGAGNTIFPTSLLAFGGPCYIFAAAGTYTVSVQFKASSGTVTVSNRRLYVKAESFA